MEEPCRTVLTTKSSKRNFTTLPQRTSFRILAYPTHFEQPIWTNSRRVTGSTWFYVSYASKVMEILFKHVIYKNRTAENEFNDLGIFWEKKIKIKDWTSCIQNASVKKSFVINSEKKSALFIHFSVWVFFNPSSYRPSPCHDTEQTADLALRMKWKKNKE